MAQRQTSKVATESIDSVYFSVFTDEEVRRYSLKKITRPVLFDDVGKPVPGGLYDPVLGPVTDGLVCKSCSQNSLHCPGHCGHIDLVAPVYNPLLFGILRNLIRKVCFFCQHFRLKREKVQAYVSQLDHIIKGDIVRALNIDLGEEEDCGTGAMYLDEEDGVAGASFQKKASKASGSRPDHLQSHKWTSLQYCEVRSVLNKFMKESSKTCENCGAKNPKITCPTFGWFQMDNMLDADIRANVIKGFHLDASFIDAAEQRSFTDNETLDAEDSLTKGNSTESLDEELSGGTRTIDSKAHRGKGEFFPAEFLKQRKLLAGPLLPSEVKDLLKRLWENEAQLCLLIFDTQRESLFMTGRTQSSNMFFIEALLVPPSKFRPPSKTHGGAVEHPQSVLLSRVVDCNISLGNAYMNDHTNVVPRWRDLQQAVNILFDSKKAIRSAEKATLGISQLLEKKEGIFRQKMMGKRVNFACRSVISPDPFLAVNEIGIPPYFALRLTYPERVTPWNVDKLRHAIINGTEIHPGATHYADKSSIVRLPPSRNARISISRRLPSSRGAVTHPGKSLESEFEGKVVYRHLQDGDIVLVNRQPTLHKPSIMAHVVRVLKGEKTLRMHYANCSTYNADFDGDEMNVHFPQDEISRSEAVNITNANQQYVVPTSGGPIRGLIQDHIISAVLLTKKDTFLNRDEYHQLLYASCVSASAAAFLDKVGRKLCTVNSDDGIQPLAPAIWKPKPLWTGKQVITTILKHITRGYPPFTITSIGKTEDGYFTKRGKKKINKPRVPKLLIRNNEFVHGVIDKSQFAKYGMVHTVQELYGSNTAGILLSVLSRLFTVFLQMHGFTCGVDDLLIEQQFDFQRKMMLEQHENIGAHIHSQFIGAKDDVDELKLQMEIEQLIRSQGETSVANLDNAMSGSLNGLTSEVNKAIIPNGLLKPLTRNCLYLMTMTGAKGSMVNFTQISSMLGQQQLEGKRVPRMVSGKTLPCFPPWDCASRAGGFIADRFLTGLRPQEYYFHCMAGREGLVDTAIKTSRSGYLQRCLVKSLESLRVCYDHTVRDADGSVIQFFYGEDGVDVHKTSFITKFKLLAVNQRIVLEKLSGQLEDASSNYIKELPDALKRKAKDYFSSLTEKQRDSLHLRKQKDFMKLVKLKYFSSLAEPGEAVGVIAAQSVGEPSTQMTLNTFHHAGRGEMNVTLGIPRLQEILQRASDKIQTPVMTCPLHMGMTRADAERLSTKLNKVTLADIVDSMEVCVVPFFVQKQQVSTIYKLKMKLYPPVLYPPYTTITEKDCEETLKVLFVRELEDSIQSHLIMLSKIRGIKNVANSEEKDTSKETEEEPEGKSQQVGEEEGDGRWGDADEIAEDLGVDAQKRKRQAEDEMDYDDDIESEVPAADDELHEREQSTGFESEIDHVDDDGDYTREGQDEMRDDEDQIFDADDEAPASLSKTESMSKLESSKTELRPRTKGKKAGAVLVKKKTDRAILVVAKGLDFEAHFCFKNEPHILLAQIAQKSAKKVYIKRHGNIEKCSVVEDKDSGTFCLQTAGVDFRAFWNMQDDLDVRKVNSNDIHAMLNTYGVEAARATILREIGKVFSHYGISVDTRHLALIADYMTSDGGYRPMNRFGIARTNTSPLCKMSFETATKFIVEAATHGELDVLETPSARVCLGLPVKLGTGCFDLMQNLQVSLS